ncbi:MAG: alpha-amylase, partial [Candidatus Electrothrix sp. AUS1_2]|nr:alpha-amylase [Candidatus Electrothrix sp. AUS1_2]
QVSETFSRKGEIRDWDAFPEYLEGDFPHPEQLYTLKDIHLGERGNGNIDDYQVSPALKHLAKAYSYWIAYADIDGYRVDTIKHMDKGATRYFASVIHEFAQSIGKENFYLIGEITGGRENAFRTMEETGLDAALGINDIPGKLEDVVKGAADPVEYFQLFRHSLELGKDSHVWFRDKVVTMFDDHDQVRKGNNKARFCRHDNGERLIAAAMALNLLTEGIPCIYYGTEQYFDGEGGNDRYIRECMFGGTFGAFRSKGRHFFTEDGELFKNISAMVDIRKKHIALRRGRQYLREISGNGFDFGTPRRMGGRMYSVIAWSRIFNNKEIVVAMNSDPYSPRSAWVTVDNDLHSSGRNMTCLFSTDAGQVNSRFPVEARNGKAVYITVPPGGVVIVQ